MTRGGDPLDSFKQPYRIHGGRFVDGTDKLRKQFGRGDGRRGVARVNREVAILARLLDQVRPGYGRAFNGGRVNFPHKGLDPLANRVDFDLAGIGAQDRAARFRVGLAGASDARSNLTIFVAVDKQISCHLASKSPAGVSHATCVPVFRSVAFLHHPAVRPETTSII